MLRCCTLCCCKLNKVNCPFGLFCFLFPPRRGFFSFSFFLSLLSFKISLFFGTRKCRFDGLFCSFWFDVFDFAVGCFGYFSNCLVGVLDGIIQVVCYAFDQSQFASFYGSVPGCCEFRIFSIDNHWLYIVIFNFSSLDSFVEGFLVTCHPIKGADEF